MRALVYLPPYWPDFDPIEQAFSKLKGYLREACARGRHALMEVIGEALGTISRPRTPRATSSTAATDRWSNLYDRRSRDLDSRLSSLQGPCASAKKERILSARKRQSLRVAGDFGRVGRP
jgi:hypothetical protein